MTKRVPISRCKRCVRYNGYYCPLLDLDPCRFVPTKEAETERAKNRLLAFVTLFGIAVAVFALLMSRKPRTEAQPEAPAPQSAVKILREYHRTTETLTDWQMLQMAIIYTESKFDTQAVGKSEDLGLYQMTPVYVREVNRVAGTDYQHTDALDPALAAEMFAAMQEAHNPGHDPARAIALHNHGNAYASRVRENLELIKRYEAARQIIITH